MPHSQPQATEGLHSEICEVSEVKLLILQMRELETQGGSSSGKGGRLPDKAGEEENPGQLSTVPGGGVTWTLSTSEGCAGSELGRKGCKT